MSRHELVPLHDTISCTVVGWERGFGSYFFQMYRTDNDCPMDIPDDELGFDFGQVTTAEKIIAEVAQYAHIPDDLRAALTADKDREGTCQAPAAVQLMNALPDSYWDDLPIPF